MVARRQRVLAPQKWWLPTGSGAAPAPAWTPHAPPPRSAGALASSAEPPAPWAGRRRQIYVSSGALWPCQIQAVQTVALLPCVNRLGEGEAQSVQQACKSGMFASLPQQVCLPLRLCSPVHDLLPDLARPGAHVCGERRSAVLWEAERSARLHRYSLQTSPFCAKKVASPPARRIDESDAVATSQGRCALQPAVVVVPT